MDLLFLLLLGLLTYLIVQRSVSGITRTPVWLLWLVMMLPTFIWIGWLAVNGRNRPMPLALMLATFAICLPLYWFLVQWGRRGEAPPAVRSTETTQDSNGTSLTSLNPSAATTEEAAQAARPIDKDEEARLKTCFPWSIYYVQTIDYRPQAVICRGQLRAKPDVAYQTIRENVEAAFGDRFLVMLQEGLNGKPFFALVPNAQAESAQKGKERPLTRPILALGLLIATCFTTTLVGAEIANAELASTAANAAAADFFQQILSDPAKLAAGLPYSLALLTILGIHESGHYLAARFYQLRATLPYFIPIPFFLGTFGAFIQIRSPMPNRKVLFDVGLAGPLAGFVVTIPILLWGLAHSTVVAVGSDATAIGFDPLNPSKSFLLLTLLSKLALGKALTVNTAIKLHPVAIAGCLGLVVTAFNLMPVGQLDGGHIVHAMFGQRMGVIIGQIARILVLVLSLMVPLLLPWAILLFFMPIVDEPALNDVTELDNQRDLWGLIALSILLAIILPTPGIVSRALL